MDLPPLAELFGFTVSPLELFVRGSAVYWFLFLIFRFVLRRDAGAIGIADILLLVLIADASQNAMSGGYQSLGEGAVVVATVIGWNWLMDWASWRFPAVRKFAEPDPLVLVRRGRLLPGNLAREFITIPELMAGLREQGIEKLAEVKLARMEPDGQISVIRNPRSDLEPPDGAPRRRAARGG
jgi:uncharacterized membrane protein YcaP (DUF421 family)